ncbi:MAG: NERD domain-containing protein [Gammaproteobacteria bacterium]|nr:NERD domain-containing protein [Gammaproteobacteria bacterium]MBK7521703.1 NERD domain-containing protein [Gammaproteobacteria bacterium]MBK9668336.1 NERD domain-containing protein [Gammaproteobacteria bacterium]
MFRLLVIAIPMIVSFSIIIATIFTLKLLRSRDRRRSPLTTDMLRQPAQGLREKLTDLNDEISAYIAAALMLPFSVSTMFFADMWRRQLNFEDSKWQFYLSTGVIVTVVVTALAFRRGTSRRKILQAVDAELVVAQELEVLRASGCRLFHDLQCGEFNIDHVVVGPGGIFAVETKSRLKPEMGGGREGVTVTYDGKALKFPGWTETKPLQQAERQARWLAQKLSKATGEPITVRGVLALPGWYVQRAAKGDVTVINPKKPEWMSKPTGISRLEDAQVQRIAYQLEQLSVVEAPPKKLR